jgi:hypothetical protein
MICAFYWKGNEKYDAPPLILAARSQAGGEKSPLSNRMAEVLYISGWIVFLHFMSRCSCVPKGGGDHTAKWKDLNAFCLSGAGREKFNSRPPMTDFSREEREMFHSWKIDFSSCWQKPPTSLSILPKSRGANVLFTILIRTHAHTDLTATRQILSPQLFFFIQTAIISIESARRGRNPSRGAAKQRD